MLHGPRFPGLAGEPHRLRPNLHRGTGSGLHEFQDGYTFRQRNGSPEVPLLGTEQPASRCLPGDQVWLAGSHLGMGERYLLRQESGPTCVLRGFPCFAGA